MSLVFGVDVGTTTISAVAVDAANGEVPASCTLANDARVTAAAPGHSEWSAEAIVARVLDTLRDLADRLGERAGECAGIGLTGQQHGVILLDEKCQAVTPFINWQDQRGEEPHPDGGTYVARARALAGPDAPARAGCALAAGFMGTTLFWMRERGVLPDTGIACFIADAVAATLAGARPATDPTHAASSGLLDIHRRAWDPAAIEALGLPLGIFPEVREAGERLGTLTANAARATGLAPGTPLFVGLGDNQASFLGSVADPRGSVLVNVGTGGQVAAYSDRPLSSPEVEARPFPRGGYLLVEAGLCGGRSYALLERFFSRVGSQVLGQGSASSQGVRPPQPLGGSGGAEPVSLYARMNELAASVPPGADGLRCEPFFAGTRSDPERRAVWSGVSTDNFTPAHLTRALLEGMARAFREGRDRIARLSGVDGWERLVGAGNGIRQNPVLAGIIAEEFGTPLLIPRHREEAAYGAALVAAFGAGLFPDLPAAGRLVRY